MSKATKKAIKKAQSIIDYQREYTNLQKAMRRMEAKWGGAYTLSLNTPLPKPSEIKNGNEARKLVRQIRQIRVHGTKSMLKYMTATSDMLATMTSTVEAKNVEKLYKAKQAEARAELKELKRITAIGKDLGMPMPKVEKPEIGTIWVKDDATAEKVVAGIKAKIKYGDERKIAAGKPNAGKTMASVFEENMNEVFDQYPDTARNILYHFRDKLPISTISDRVKAHYRSTKGSGDDLAWLEFWDSVGTNRGILGENWNNWVKILSIPKKEAYAFADGYSDNDTAAEFKWYNILMSM